MSGYIERRAVHDAVAFCLGQKGATIRDLEGQAGRRYGQDASQNEYGRMPVWHRRADLIVSVAKKLRIHPDMWGPHRKTSDFYNVIDQEIAKLRAGGAVADWSAGRRLGVMRLAQRPAGRMQMSTEKRARMRDPVAGAYADDLKQKFLAILTRGKKDNTYKFTLAKSLLDYCRENAGGAVRTHEISYEYLSAKFLRYYWYQEYKFKMKQDFHVRGKPKVIRAINEVFGSNPPGDFELLDNNDIERARQKIQRTVFGHARSKTSLVVPRFQNVPSGSGVMEARAFYDYDDDAQKIYLRPEAFEFLRTNDALLSRVVLAEWARYLEKVNHALPRLVAKIDQDSTARGSLLEYKRMYFEHTDHCFYCGGRLERGGIHVDHFIPWSYIFEDSAWNLVLACKECNCKKSSSLPHEEFRDILIRRNTRHYGRIQKLRVSLDQLDSGKGWKPEIINHYENCLAYGFGTVSLP